MNTDKWIFFISIACFSAFLACAGPAAMASAPAGEDADEQAMIDYLKGLGLEQWPEVEVSLDDVFDVFDGLIKARKVSIAATGDKQSAAKAPAVTTVITAQNIEATGARDLDEVLQAVPGLYVSHNFIGNSLYSLRGISSTFNPEVLMLVNGIRLNNSQDLYFGQN
ncbi:MAG: TonB-dependent receptor plug domain-containing protein [Gammaproteobacteria bacterium]|nr:TonB-dependent receptor plug domain-containing protein [Gammaproteobacteria bacterium]